METARERAGVPATGDAKGAALRIALTSNGPGELAGWVRPLVSELLRQAPHAELTLFFVPDDYATGREADVARALFPGVRVVPPRDYVRFALGRGGSGAPERADAVLYLGGDLMHALRVHARLGGKAFAYKFSRRRHRRTFARVYAVDARNVTQLEGWGVPPERIETVGNLAIDGALGEAAGRFAAGAGDADRLPQGGVLIMPGTRKHEIANLIPFFLQAVLRLRAAAPGLPVAFGLSPFTARDELSRALERGGHPNVWGARGSVIDWEGGLALQPAAGGAPVPIVRDALRAAQHAKLVVTIPGTKCIELAALGVPALVCVPLNAPEVVVINGPLQYLDRLPVLGIPLKRAAVVAVDARFPLTAQPNIDAGEELMPELRGTLTPGYVARRIAAYAADDAARASAAQRLRALYAAHAGAAERMARSLLAAAS
jgi:lipid-A-disaccharide synthase